MVPRLARSSLRCSCFLLLAPFAGLDRPDQPTDPPHISLFIKPAKQCFSLTQPASFSQVSDQRTGLFCDFAFVSLISPDLDLDSSSTVWPIMPVAPCPLLKDLPFAINFFLQLVMKILDPLLKDMN